MNDFDELLKAVTELGGSEDLVTKFREERTAKNEADKKKRKTDREILDTLMEKFNVTDKKEIIDKVDPDNNTAKKLKKDLDEFKSKYESEVSERKKVELTAKINEVLGNKGIKANKVITAGLLELVEDSNEAGLLVGDKSLDEYIQSEFIDDVETNRKSKIKDLDNTGDDLFTSDELDKITKEQMRNPEIMKKVDASIRALG